MVKIIWACNMPFGPVTSIFYLPKKNVQAIQALCYNRWGRFCVRSNLPMICTALKQDCLKYQIQRHIQYALLLLMS